MTGPRERGIMKNKDDNPRHDDEQAPRQERGAPGERGPRQERGEEAQIPADVQVNADGSITIAETGEVKGPAPTRWVGGGIKPDTRYSSLLVSKFINCLMYDGKKSTAEEIFSGAMEQIAN